ncbi:zf-HC2 domain-containing protein, partial [Myxococcota bacterium]|nr:zf-HC2 domain-containing protein [Myxococcota bacterium]
MSATRGAYGRREEIRVKAEHPSALRLLQYQSGELEGAARAAIEAHLARCPACAARLETGRASAAA